jgi:hypothetical protein
MPIKNPDKPAKPTDASDRPALPPGPRLEDAGRVSVSYESTPKGPADKQIHPRRRLPEIPDAPPRSGERK